MKKKNFNNNNNKIFEPECVTGRRVYPVHVHNIYIRVFIVHVAFLGLGVRLWKYQERIPFFDT